MEIVNPQSCQPPTLSCPPPPPFVSTPSHLGLNPNPSIPFTPTHLGLTPGLTGSKQSQDCAQRPVIAELMVDGERSEADRVRLRSNIETLEDVPHRRSVGGERCGGIHSSQFILGCVYPLVLLFGWR